MSGEIWRIIEISKAEAVRDTVKTTFGIHSPAYKDLDTETKRLVRDRKTEIWKRKFIKEKGTNEMWWILRSLTASQPADTARIISKNGTNYANAFAKLYRDVSWLQIDKPDRGLKKRLNGRLRFDPILRGQWRLHPE